MTEIHEAASEGDDEKLLDALKSGEDVNERDVDCGGRTALHWAASRGHIECCRLLIANGANSQITSFAGWTPLHSAAEAGHSSCVRYLLTTGVRASESDKAGDTARRVAERYGHRECAKLLKSAEASERKAELRAEKQRDTKPSPSPEGSDRISPRSMTDRLEYNSDDDLQAIKQRFA